ncbi:hypothetical protein HanPI659440_Chr16g0627651 [Helianthus annuus]|nr:hypothetical protein HanPI659440_Chr16g0627651 [Helianthus annuus]
MVCTPYVSFERERMNFLGKFNEKALTEVYEKKKWTKEVECGGQKSKSSLKCSKCEMNQCLVGIEIID